MLTIVRIISNTFYLIEIRHLSLKDVFNLINQKLKMAEPNSKIASNCHVNIVPIFLK